MPNQDYISARETLERLVRLEETVRHKFEEHERALVLARNALDSRLEGMNQFQKRIDRLENTFATKTELNIVQRYIYIAIGILITAEVMLKFFVK